MSCINKLRTSEHAFLRALCQRTACSQGRGTLSTLSGTRDALNSLSNTAGCT